MSTLNRALTPDEKGIATELNNLFCEAGSNTLSGLIGQDVTITLDDLTDVDNPEALDGMLAESSVMVLMSFQEGFSVPAAYILEQQAAIQLGNAIMGNPPDQAATELSDMELSAIGEAMNQMVSAAASTMSLFGGVTIETSSANVLPYSLDILSEEMPGLEDTMLTVATYTLQAGETLPPAKLIQMMPSARLIEQLEKMAQDAGETPSDATPAQSGTESSAAPASSAGGSPGGVSPPQQSGGSPAPGQTGVSDPVTVQPVEFTSFENHVPASGPENKNLELVMDVMLNLTVELGRAEIPIKDVLELTRGSVIELDRIAGEPVDLMANGKLIAKGEVVVIEDNFGLRITSIVSPADRLRGLS